MSEWLLREYGSKLKAREEPMESLKPLPCPLCGSADVIVSDQPHWSVLCRTCGCEGPRTSQTPSAITAWNSRPQSEIERLAGEVVREHEALNESRRWMTLRKPDTAALETSLDALALAVRKEMEK